MSDLISWWPADRVHGVPSCIVRCALFGVVKKGGRENIFQREIAAQKDIRVMYSGPQLDQADLDTLLALFAVGRESAKADWTGLISPCIAAKHLLQAMGRATGGGDFRWLMASLTRLQMAVIEIQHDQLSYSGQLVRDVYRDDETGQLHIELNSKLAELFGRNRFTRIDIYQRRQLRGNQLALWLHAFYSSHSSDGNHRFSTAGLQKLCGSKSELKEFRRGLRDALKLVAKFTGWKLELRDDRVFVDKNESF